MRYAVTAVIIMALVTYIPRVLPITILKKPIQSTFLRSFLYYVPYAVLAALTFPGIFFVTAEPVTAICGTIAAVLLALFDQSLVVVALGAIAAVFFFFFFCG